MKIILISTSTTPGDQGLRSISKYLKKAGHPCQIIFLTYTENYDKLYPKKVLRQLLHLCKDSDLIGISSYASTAPRASQVIKTLRYLNKPIVYGGVHATISPERCIKEADYVIVGEAEEAFLELVNKFEKKKPVNKIKNLWLKKDDKIIKNPLRPLIKNIDKIPFPDYNLATHYILENDKIIRFGERHLGGMIFFLTGRGCPYSCTYCSNAYFNKLYSKMKHKPVRWHSIDYIIRNILFMASQFPSLKIFDIRDDTFFARPIEHFKEFNKKYKEKVGLRFKCLSDPKLITDGKISLLVDAGCTDIIVGIQGTERVNLEIYKRDQTDEDVLRAARILNKYKNKLTVMYDVITCNPYEHPRDVINMIRLLQKLPKSYFLSVNNLVFFTGSELYNRAKQDGIIKTEIDSAFNLNYWDRFKHIKLKKKNAYLNLILNLMRGVATKKRFGIMPNSLINVLLNKSLVNLNLKFKLPTYLAGYILSIFDNVRENIAKPFYRSLPVNFKVWYDRRRYKA